MIYYRLSYIPIHFNPCLSGCDYWLEQCVLIIQVPKFWDLCTNHQGLQQLEKFHLH